ncbi:hypothetical protein M438DRAFT_343526 [Aureobasidium pullulans EXF-150]|uniref:Uncharacterized protein n=1 Tax=Aureobasidium pullulans EXF-150 TaxID=1043002 RepID=A0A074XYW3_AURPU|nr:uncharacterized protein M438DRAFT_343526 [Aureobasidium pullulans EXF-150]KEQ87147.1 hypothetical protein M438DRAFT_343526 [Aureobasidium pullulans EXF-150]
MPDFEPVACACLALCCGRNRSRFVFYQWDRSGAATRLTIKLSHGHQGPIKVPDRVCQSLRPTTKTAIHRIISSDFPSTLPA